MHRVTTPVAVREHVDASVEVDAARPAHVVTHASTHVPPQPPSSDAATRAPQTPHKPHTPQTKRSAAPIAHIALLGTGTVGRAVLERLQHWRETGFALGIELAYVANSRQAWSLDTSSRDTAPPGFTHATPQSASPPGRGVGERAGGAAKHPCATWINPSIPQSGSSAATTLQSLETINHRPGTSHANNASIPSILDPAHDLQGHPLQKVEGDCGADASNPFAHLEEHGALRILIDATPSAQVAARHADWLSQGIHVVTACKLARGTSLAQWRAIEDAQRHGHAQYGDAATVGAGLPILRMIRELQAGGDRIHSIAGVLSGSLAWLFNQYDGMRPFSALVRQARAAGYTEPDPREDLSGEDVRRKLLILARAAGVPLESSEVRVESLVPSALALLSTADVDRGLELLDAPLRARFAAAWKAGEVLRFIARIESGRAQVGLESLPASHPLAVGAGTDNRVAIHSDRYPVQPLVIQGPGAGAQVTASALLDDVLRIARAA